MFTYSLRFEFGFDSRRSERRTRVHSSWALLWVCCSPSLTLLAHARSERVCFYCVMLLCSAITLCESGNIFCRSARDRWRASGLRETKMWRNQPLYLYINIYTFMHNSSVDRTVRERQRNRNASRRWMKSYLLLYVGVVRIELKFCFWPHIEHTLVFLYAIIL